MRVRQSLVKAVALMLLGSSALAMAEDNPFAEWDRKNPKKPAHAASRRNAAAMTYFSPTAASATPTAADAANASTASSDKPAVAVPMRERTATDRNGGSTTQPDKISRIAAPRSSLRATDVPVELALPTPATRKSSAVAGPPALNTNLSQSAVVTPPAKESFGWSTEVEPAQASGSVISTAEFALVEEEEANSAIQQVSGTVQDKTSFDEFLTEPTAKPRSSKAVPADDGESVEPLIRRKAPDRAAQSIAKGSASGARAADGSVVAHSVSRSSSSAFDVEQLVAGPQSPGVTVQWVRKGSFNVGQSCDVELVVQNTSKSVVRSVMTEAVIPAEVEVVEAIPSPMEGTETPTWTFGELQPGESRSVSLKVIPHRRGDVRLDAFVRLTGYSSSEFAVEEPMIGVAVTGPDSVEVGEQAGYVVRVSNPGTGVASNVVIQAAIPEGLEHRGGSLLNIEIGTLNPGESRQARLSLTAVRGGAHKLAVRAVAEGGLTDQSTAAITVAEPKLSIELAGPPEHLAGRPADYTVTVANSGNVPSANVRAKYRLPQGFEFVSADRGGKYSETDHSIEWFVGTLQATESSEFNVTLKATAAGELMHQAGVISEHGQVTMCNLSTTIEGTAALDLKIVADQKDFAVGDEVDYIVTIANSGSREATGVGMSCELPAGLELISADGPSEHIAENGVMVFRSLKTIDAGSDAVFNIRARCTREGSLRLRLRVASESISEPLIGEEASFVTAR